MDEEPIEGMNEYPELSYSALRMGGVEREPTGGMGGGFPRGSGMGGMGGGYHPGMGGGSPQGMGEGFPQGMQDMEGGSPGLHSAASPQSKPKKQSAVSIDPDELRPSIYDNFHGIPEGRGPQDYDGPEQKLRQGLTGQNPKQNRNKVVSTITILEFYK